MNVRFLSYNIYAFTNIKFSYKKRLGNFCFQQTFLSV